MDLQVTELLEATQSPQQDVRKSAEERIDQLQRTHTDTFSISLINIAQVDSYPIAIRQAALVVLRMLILKSWSAQFDEFAWSTPLANEVKQSIRKELIVILQSVYESKIRSLTANLISKIASADFPDEWPELFNILMELLKSSSEDQIYSALTVLKELLDDGFTLEQFGSIASPIFDALHSIAISQTWSFYIKALTVDTIHASLNFFEQIDSKSGSLKAFILKAVESWSGVFSSFMNLSYNDETRKNNVALLKYSTMKAIQQLDSTFPEETEKFIINPLFNSVWADLPKATSLFLSLYCDPENEADFSNLEGEPRYTKLLLIEILEFLRNKSSNSDINRFYKEEYNLQELVALAAAISQISVEEEREFEDDSNMFVAEELSLSSKFTCRTAASDLVTTLDQPFVASIIPILANRVIELASQNSWRMLEGAMFLLESVLVEDTDYGKYLISSSTAEPLMSIAASCFAHQNVFLRARSYILAGTVCRNCKAFMSSMETPVKLLDNTLLSGSTDESFLVRASCLFSIQRFLSEFSRKNNKASQMAIVEAVASLIEDAEDETPSLLVESLELAIRISPGFAILPDSKVIELLFRAAAKDPSNIQLTSDTIDAFEFLSQSTDEYLYPRFCETAIPPLVSGLTTNITDENVFQLALIINLLSSLVDHAPSPLPIGLVDFVFPKIASLMLIADDNQILQNGSEFIAHIIEHDSQQLRDWHDEYGKSGVEVVLNIIARLLNPDIEESSAMCIGEVVTAVVDRYGHDLGDLLNQLLIATARRLEKASHPVFIQNLILVFANMISIDPQTVVNFLYDMPLEHANGLVVVLKAWLGSFDVFRGYKEIRLNTMALAKCYMLHDPRVESIIVDGDLITDDADSSIITRSRAKKKPLKYTSIPAHIKILKLLLKELSSITDISSTSNEMARAQEKSNTTSIEGDEWEDISSANEFAYGLSVKDIRKLEHEASEEYDDYSYTGESDTSLFDNKGGDEETNEILTTFIKAVITNEQEHMLQLGSIYFTPLELETLKFWQNA
ncbi:armadillo-type protein [Dipodascopsis uninucleata]